MLPWSRRRASRSRLGGGRSLLVEWRRRRRRFLWRQCGLRMRRCICSGGHRYACGRLGTGSIRGLNRAGLLWDLWWQRAWRARVVVDYSGGRRVVNYVSHCMARLLWIQVLRIFTGCSMLLSLEFGGGCEEQKSGKFMWKPAWMATGRGESHVKLIPENTESSIKFWLSSLTITWFNWQPYPALHFPEIDHRPFVPLQSLCFILISTTSRTIPPCARWAHRPCTSLPPQV